MYQDILFHESDHGLDFKQGYIVFVSVYVRKKDCNWLMHRLGLMKVCKIACLEECRSIMIQSFLLGDGGTQTVTSTLFTGHLPSFY